MSEHDHDHEHGHDHHPEPLAPVEARVAAIEAVLVHLSHAQTFSRQNPGMDSIGLRFTWSLR